MQSVNGGVIKFLALNDSMLFHELSSNLQLGEHQKERGRQTSGPSSSRVPYFEARKRTRGPLLAHAGSGAYFQPLPTITFHPQRIRAFGSPF